ncbi:hypothetical protein ACM39_18110 [Chryseobacterium sp. FH2]|uniref:hypothetical protein n=1 Tax=Chryseobacterium sp. FH2 TaxID=1674291 RepID=UPI00065A9AFF|nr:hypothetical protein [Chryseobacterium sp. FH2]KMQ59876.1 hypothetical protein ACM39_18110 [Chryseobacterium sp. FH2]
MKNLILTTLAFAGGIVFTAFSSSDNLMNVAHASEKSADLKEISKTKTYKIRFGLLSKNGTKILSGNYDVGSFIATNNMTGESFDTYYGGGFQSLPVYYEGIPAGTYTFSAMQGQGGWVGYGSVVGTVSDLEVDADGYVTVYIPIAWEE